MKLSQAGKEFLPTRPNVIDCIALAIVGGLNWGLVGLFDWNLVTTIFGEASIVTDIVNIFVGVVALWTLYVLARLDSPESARGLGAGRAVG